MVAQVARRRFRASPCGVRLSFPATVDVHAAFMKASRFRYHVLAGLLVALIWMPAASAKVSYANVRSDATILVGSRLVRLYGIYIPPTGRTCRSTIRPAKCGSNAALALDFKPGEGAEQGAEQKDEDQAGGTFFHGGFLHREGGRVV